MSAAGAVGLFGLASALWSTLSEIYLGEIRPFRSAAGIVLAGLALWWALYHLDWQLSYVTEHIHSELSPAYRLAAFWSGSEGSWLLSLLTLSLWRVLFESLAKKHLRDTESLNVPSLQQVQRCLAGLLSAGLFGALSAQSCFRLERQGVVLEGADLNPLLQDPSMMIHPPFLIAGLMGFSLIFAFSIVCLLHLKRNRLTVHDLSQPALLPLMRALIAWPLFTLTVGILLGSYWAYYELGWGGFWFWDPVENASLMPWLCALSWLHLSRQGPLKASLIGIGLLPFLLVLVGAWMVRSGLIHSVHSFAQQSHAAKWLACLGIGLLLSTGWLYCSTISLRNNRSHHPTPPESLPQTVGWTALTLMLLVLAGTLLPTFFEHFLQRKMALNSTYFNRVGLFLISALFIGLAWQIGTKSKDSRWGLIALLIAGLGNWMLFNELPLHQAPLTFLATVLCSAFALFSSRKLWTAPHAREKGAWLCHLGLGLLLWGALLQAEGSRKWEGILQEGQSFHLKGNPATRSENENHIALESVSPSTTGHYGQEQGAFTLTHGKRSLSLIAARRYFWSSELYTSELGIKPDWWGDWYLGLGERVAPATWQFQLEFKFMIRLVFLGGGLMAIGLLWSFLGRRSTDKTRQGE